MDAQPQQAGTESRSNPLIEAQGIKKYFYRQPSLLARLVARQQPTVLRAVDGVDLPIWPGETVGLVGESGCGKTTLGRVLVRLYEPTAGQVLYDGRPVTGATGFHRTAQIIFQNPYSSLNPRKTVREILAVPLRKRGLNDPKSREEETIRLLRRVGLRDRHIDSYPHQFSGGQRQRIGVARAIAMQPHFIVADEPVSSLDVSIQAQVLNLLEELQAEYYLTYLFISHDLSVVHHVSNRVAVMYLGHIVEEGPTDALFANPLHPYTQALLAAVPRVDKAQRRQRIILTGSVPSPIDPPSGCPFHPRCFAKIGQICEERYPPFFKIGTQQTACWIHQDQPSEPDPNSLSQPPPRAGKGRGEGKTGEGSTPSPSGRGLG
jgi:oligopeptide/dipeptide ABC transporter ATP-binding protein